MSEPTISEIREAWSDYREQHDYEEPSPLVCPYLAVEVVGQEVDRLRSELTLRTDQLRALDAAMTERVSELEAENDRLHGDYRIQNDAIVSLQDQLKVAVEALEEVDLARRHEVGVAKRAIARIREMGEKHEPR